MGQHRRAVAKAAGTTIMIVTVFRSRLKPGVRDQYIVLVDQMEKLARTMPGYISHKGFFADDGEIDRESKFNVEAAAKRAPAAARA
jgi:antibiotic biosynthesis monooxygenase (ABM) superfamily enzyme